MTKNKGGKDILDCLADLSSDEVFTPPVLVNKMLDLLPQELFENPNTTFLDPCCKSGVFLREIVKRLNVGLSKLPEFNNLYKRIDHILTKQVFGIATSELTSLISRRSLYCSKNPNGKYSILSNVNYANGEGNVFWHRVNHVWDSSGKCKFCGAPNSMYVNEEGKENYAYLFIHGDLPKEILNMKFDVIIGNPPYQLNDGGGTGTSSTAIYNKFVEAGKSLMPRYFSMIIPARWYSGGKGKDISKFRKDMLGDKRIRYLVDYENFRDVFPGVDLAGGACYFLWDRDNPGICQVTNFSKNKESKSKRYLNEFDVFIRSNSCVPIVRKIRKLNYKKFLSDRVLPRLPFEIPTTYKPVSYGVPCYFTQKEGIKFVRPQDVKDKFNVLNKWKFLVPKAPIAGQTDFTKPVGFFYTGNTRIAKPNECCSESWLVAGAFDSEDEALSFRSYIFTKTVRFLLLQTVVSQNITSKNFEFIPDLGKYNQIYSDAVLCKMWGITKKEWEIINSKIGEIGRTNL